MYIKDLAKSMGLDPAEVRRINHNLRAKGYGVLGGKDGMYKTDSLYLKQQQAEKLIRMASDIQAAAEGLIRGERGELTEEEAILWNMLTEKSYTPEVFRTLFEPIEVREDGTIE